MNWWQSPSTWGFIILLELETIGLVCLVGLVLDARDPVSAAAWALGVFGAFTSAGALMMSIE